MRLFAIFFIFLPLISSFEIEERLPEREGREDVVDHYVRIGETVTLRCKASEKFSLCQWNRPGGMSCGLLDDQSKKCVSKGSMSRWTLERVDDQTCDLIIDNVDDSERGQWTCELRSTKDESIQESTNLQPIRPALVELKGPSELILFDGESVDFQCKAKGTPKPVRLEWTIGRSPIAGMTVKETRDGEEDVFEEIVTAKVTKDWSGKELTCHAVQVGDQGNEVENSDVRRLRVENSRAVAEESGLARGGVFTITNRYPEGPRGDVPEVVLAPDTEVTFSCTSTLPWNLCRWKHPKPETPCGAFSDMAGSKSCANQWNSMGVGGQEWKIRRSSSSTCTITGKVSDLDEGGWNCELQSNPLANEHDKYEADQQYFNVKVISQPQFKHDMPDELELAEGEEKEITVEIENAFPMPEILWRLNTKLLKPELISSDPPMEDAEGRFTFSQTIKYKATHEDSGKRLICIVRQEDSEGEIVEQQHEVFIAVTAKRPAAPLRSMGAGIIAAIVSVAAFILLIIILCCVAAKTGKLCFKRKEEKKPLQSEMDVQTEKFEGTEIGTTAAFGPAKPMRQKEYIQRDDQMLAPHNDEADELLKAGTFAQDETVGYNEEGGGSAAGSLASLNIDVPDRDWKETLQVLGPKFSEMADMVRPGAGATDDDLEAGSVRNSMAVPDDFAVEGKRQTYESDSEV